MSPTVQYVPRHDSEITTIKVSFSELVVCANVGVSLVYLKTYQQLRSACLSTITKQIFICLYAYTYVNTYICEYMHMHVNVRLCIKLISSIKRISMFR